MDQERPFTLLDAMILIAAVAVGLVIVRATWPDWDFVLRHEVKGAIASSSRHGALGTRLFLGVQHFIHMALPMLAALSAAALCLRLRPPRPTTRRLVREPGYLASAIACLLVLLSTIWMLGMLVAAPSTVRPTVMFVTHYDRLGLGILGLWIGLLWTGRWRPRSSWIDRLGRSLGWAWIAIVIISMCRYFALAIP